MPVLFRSRHNSPFQGCFGKLNEEGCSKAGGETGEEEICFSQYFAAQ